MTKEERLKMEEERLGAMLAFEKSLTGPARFVFGIDEAGRGPLCGPVTAACVILPEDARILWLNDSKKLSEKKREELFPQIRETALAWGIGMAGPERIDQINILNATLEAMGDAFRACSRMLSEKGLCSGFSSDNSLVLVDGNRKIPSIGYPQLTVIGGDAKCPSVSAASILAKVTRDRLLLEYDRTWPGYGFAKHKGYGTKEHMDAIRRLGILPVHRRSFLGKLTDEH